MHQHESSAFVFITGKHPIDTYSKSPRRDEYNHQTTRIEPHSSSKDQEAIWEFPRSRGPDTDPKTKNALVIRTPTKGASNFWQQPKNTGSLLEKPKDRAWRPWSVRPPLPARASNEKPAFESPGDPSKTPCFRGPRIAAVLDPASCLVSQDSSRMHG